MIFDLFILAKIAVERMSVFQYANLAKWYASIFSMFCIYQWGIKFDFNIIGWSISGISYIDIKIKAAHEFGSRVTTT